MFKFFLSWLQWAGVFGLHFDGGGSAPAPAPTQTTVTNTNLPDYVQPYLENVLGKSQALTSAPYQTYGGERTAGFTPLQQQSFSRTAGQQVAPQIGTATGMATGIGNAATDAGAFGSQVGQYMSPYMQNVVDIQKREATRQSNIQGQDQQAQAAQAGAFGGYREAIQRAERERNLNQQLGDIQQRGTQAAYDSGAAQLRAGQGLGLQAAQGLGQLGQAKFSQDTAITQGMNAAGNQQQQLEQTRLGQQYQDFQNQQNYPYKQLGFMSDLIRGVPGTAAAQTIYSAPPSTGGQLAGLGTLAAGILKAKGGKIDVNEKARKPKKDKRAGLNELALMRMGV